MRKLSFWIGLFILLLPLVVIGAPSMSNSHGVRAQEDPNPQPSPTTAPEIEAQWGVSQGSFVGNNLTVQIIYDTQYSLTSVKLLWEGSEIDMISHTAGNQLMFNPTSTEIYNFDTSHVPEGLQALTLVVQNSNGSTFTTSSSFSFDHTPPSCVYVYPITPPINSWVSGYQSLQVQSQDAMSGVLGVYLQRPDNNLPDPYVNMVGSNDFIYSDFNTALLPNSVTPNGPVLFDSVCVDRANNASLPITTPMRIDNINPLPSLAVAPAPIINGADQLVRGTVVLTPSAIDTESGVDTLSVKVDGVVLANMNLNTVGYMDGTHSIETVAKDMAGNFGTSTQLLKFDNTAPVVNIASPIEGSVQTTLPTIQADIVDVNGIGLIEILIDSVVQPFNQNGNFFVISTPLTLTDGAHTIRFRVTDKAGNQALSQNRTIVINGGGGPGEPLVGDFNVAFLYPATGAYLKGTVNLQATVANGVAVSANFNINNVLSVPLAVSINGYFSYPLDTTTLPNGAAVLQAIAVKADNTQVTATLPVVIDNILPQVISLTPLDDSSVFGLVPIQGIISDNMGLSSVELYIDSTLVAASVPNGALSTPIGFSWDSSLAMPGVHLIRVRALDRAGNEQWTVHEVTVGRDMQIPVITVLNPQQGDSIRAITPLRMRLNGPVVNTGFRVDFTGTTIQGSLVPGSGDEYTANLNTTQFTDGFHTLYYTAETVTATGSENIQVRIDNTLPGLSVSKPMIGQVIFAPVSFIAQASDSSGVPLAKVEFSLNSQLLAYFPGNTNLTNTTYSYLFDTTALDDSNNRLYPDGAYQLLVVATDAAGNTSQTTVPFTINVANPPIAPATFVWTPSRPFVVTQTQSMVSVAISNAAVDPTTVNDNTLKIFVTKDGETNKRWDGPVQLVGNTLRFLGVIPDNARVSCSVEAVSTNGEAIRGTNQFIRAMSRTVGGVVTINPEELLKINIPSGALSQDALVELIKQPESQFPDLAPNSTLVTVYGPIQFRAINEKGHDLPTLLLSAQMSFQRGTQGAPIPPSQGNGFVDAAQRYQEDRNIWRDLGNSGSASIGAKGNPGIRTIAVPIREFGVYRVTALPIPSSGLGEIYNAPNPFSPSEGGTDFVYLLGADSEVDLVIYDLFGNLVRHMEISAGSIGGKAGPNTVHWDGKNGSGDNVGNGGYIAQVTAKDSSGSVVRGIRKVAVAK